MTISNDMTFDTFTIDPSNQLAFDEAKKFASTLKVPWDFPFIYIYGKTGLGKTHLLNAIAHKIAECHPEKKIRLLDAREFTDELVYSIQKNQFQDFAHKYREELDVLLIDDIQWISRKDRTQEELLHIFNSFLKSKKTIIFTCDTKPENIVSCDDWIRSRLNYATHFELLSPSFETAMALITTKCQHFNISIQHQVAEAIARTYSYDIRKMIGSIINLGLYQRHRGKDLEQEELFKYLDLDPQ